MTKEKYERLQTAIKNLSNAAALFKGTKQEHEQLSLDKKLLLEFLVSVTVEESKENQAKVEKGQEEAQTK